MPQQQQSEPRPSFQQSNCPNGNHRCYNCGSPAHFARNNPQKQKPAQGQNSNQNSNQNKGKKQVLQVKQGRVNFTTLIELPGDAPIMRGTFSIPHKPVVTLLDSGVICSFWNKKKAWTFAI